jgi:flagellar hook-length control protein FliK
MIFNPLFIKPEIQGFTGEAVKSKFSGSGYLFSDIIKIIDNGGKELSYTDSTFPPAVNQILSGVKGNSAGNLSFKKISPQDINNIVNNLFQENGVNPSQDPAKLKSLSDNISALAEKGIDFRIILNINNKIIKLGVSSDSDSQMEITGGNSGSNATSPLSLLSNKKENPVKKTDSEENPKDDSLVSPLINILFNTIPVEQQNISLTNPSLLNNSGFENSSDQVDLPSAGSNPPMSGSGNNEAPPALVLKETTDSNQQVVSPDITHIDQSLSASQNILVNQESQSVFTTQIPLEELSLVKTQDTQIGLPNENMQVPQVDLNNSGIQPPQGNSIVPGISLPEEKSPGNMQVLNVTAGYFDSPNLSIDISLSDDKNQFSQTSVIPETFSFFPVTMKEALTSPLAHTGTNGAPVNIAGTDLLTSNQVNDYTLAGSIKETPPDSQKLFNVNVVVADSNIKPVLQLPLRENFNIPGFNGLKEVAEHISDFDFFGRYENNPAASSLNIKLDTVSSLSGLNKENGIFKPLLYSTQIYSSGKFPELENNVVKNQEELTPLFVPDNNNNVQVLSDINNIDEIKPKNTNNISEGIPETSDNIVTDPVKQVLVKQQVEALGNNAPVLQDANVFEIKVQRDRNLDGQKIKFNQTSGNSRLPKEVNNKTAPQSSSKDKDKNDFQGNLTENQISHNPAAKKNSQSEPDNKNISTNTRAVSGDNEKSDQSVSVKDNTPNNINPSKPAETAGINDDQVKDVPVKNITETGTRSLEIREQDIAAVRGIDSPARNIVKNNIIQTNELNSQGLQRVKSEDLVREIHKILTKENSQKVVLNLSPEELGSVKIEFDIKEKSLNAKITVDTEFAKNIIQTHSETLRNSLQDSGLTLNTLNIELSDNQRQQRPTASKKKIQKNELIENPLDVTSPQRSLGYNTYEYLA